MKRSQLFAIVNKQSKLFSTCIPGSIVEIELNNEYNLDKFIQLPSKKYVWVKFGFKKFEIQKSFLKDFWMIF